MQISKTVSVMKVANLASVPVLEWCSDKEDRFVVVKSRKHKTS